MVVDLCGSVTDMDKTFFPPQRSVAAAGAIEAAVGERDADHGTVRQYTRMPRDHCTERCACIRVAWHATCGCSVSHDKLRSYA